MSDLSNLELAENARLNVKTFLQMPDRALLQLAVQELDTLITRLELEDNEGYCWPPII